MVRESLREGMKRLADPLHQRRGNLPHVEPDPALGEAPLGQRPGQAIRGVFQPLQRLGPGEIVLLPPVPSVLNPRAVCDDVPFLVGIGDQEGSQRGVPGEAGKADEGRAVGQGPRIVHPEMGKVSGDVAVGHL